MKIYTRGGDDGSTSLMSGERHEKSEAIFDLLGDLDELNSALGLCRVTGLDPILDTTISRVQSFLLDLGAHCAAPTDARFAVDSSDFVGALEAEIDSMTNELAPLTQFILPGGSPASAQLHFARAVARRAERSLVRSGISTNVGIFLNRLSDWLFTAARYQSNRDGYPDVHWSKS